MSYGVGLEDLFFESVMDPKSSLSRCVHTSTSSTIFPSPRSTNVESPVFNVFFTLFTVIVLESVKERSTIHQYQKLYFGSNFLQKFILIEVRKDCWLYFLNSGK